LNRADEGFQQNLKQLEAADTQVLGVSMDSPFANKASPTRSVSPSRCSVTGRRRDRQYGLYVDKYKARAASTS